jgi:hypothetical protein
MEPIIIGLALLIIALGIIYELNRRDRKQKKFDVEPPF